MKTPLIILFLVTSLISQAQTAIIAHKSHSGRAVDFFTDPNTNFGEPGPQLLQIVRLNDSTYIQVFREFSGMIYHDTVRKNSPWSNYNPKFDSIYQQGYYKQHIKYINLENKADTGRIQAPSLQLQKMIEKEVITPENQDVQPMPEENTPKKKKKSYLLFLFGITGGGMLLMRLFSRSKTTKPLIA
ncbi:hypothetical protein [uncultured Fluviicola sp.]|uniref:hypothetical protein n=1 Tax=uncultured Fluviicola sp. TaxID=463303 RepID=UPI0025CC2FA3|nr:hypothetical protein [uncultured Fluviicola sp.]